MFSSKAVAVVNLTFHLLLSRSAAWVPIPLRISAALASSMAKQPGQSSRSRAGSSHEEEVHDRHSKNLLTPFVRARDLRPLPGDLIEFDRNVYRHWALYVGDGKVIHVGGGMANADVSFTGTGHVKMNDLEDVAGASLVRINNQEEKAAARGLGPVPTEKLIEDARKLVGTDVHYDLFKRNCEHYVTEWRYGQPWSDQVDRGFKEFANVATDVRQQYAPQIMNALQNYMNSRSETVRANVIDGRERFKNYLTKVVRDRFPLVPESAARHVMSYLGSTASGAARRVADFIEEEKPTPGTLPDDSSGENEGHSR